MRLLQIPWAEAMAVQAGRLQAVGSWEAVGKLKRGSKATVVDLLGRVVLPVRPPPEET